jgi:hypothetical protein
VRVERRDYGAIKRATPTTQGGLRFAAFPTRAGVLVYRNPDGSARRELRHPDDVFKPEALASLAHATLTDRHPEGRVDTSNYRALTIGHVAENVRKSDEQPGHVACDVIVNDAEMIRLIDSGERGELSCGYTCDLLDEQGEFEGEHYDARQVGHVYNHLALLGPGEARGGATCALKTDGKDVRFDGLVIADAAKPKSFGVRLPFVTGVSVPVRA